MPIVSSVDPHNPDPVIIRRAADVIRAGGLVGMPTETVYGLAANALDPVAIQRIFTAKGRPSQNPLIAHAADLDGARALAAEWPVMAQELATRFWPGPLTLVLRRRSIIPDALTAGLGTFGVRVPDHPVALALIRASGVPLAAPSANRFTELSPVTAAQVARGLGDSVDLILDAGRTRVGIESTVLDVSGGRPVLLRPGMIPREELEAVVGPVSRGAAPSRADSPHRSPGMSARHYAPRGTLRLIDTDALDDTLRAAVARVAEGARIGALVISGDPARHGPLTFALRLPDDAAIYASTLYDTLHASDAAGCTEILVERPPDETAWDAVHDRLTRAAHTD